MLLNLENFLPIFLILGLLRSDWLSGIALGLKCDFQLKLSHSWIALFDSYLYEQNLGTKDTRDSYSKVRYIRVKLVQCKSEQFLLDPSEKWLAGQITKSDAWNLHQVFHVCIFRYENYHFTTKSWAAFGTRIKCFTHFNIYKRFIINLQYWICLHKEMLKPKQDKRDWYPWRKPFTKPCKLPKCWFIWCLTVLFEKAWKVAFGIARCANCDQ